MTVFDDLSHIRAFVCIVESGSISAAARKLHLTQPTLSRQLVALEERCETALLRRDTHRMNLTQTGHKSLEAARAILALSEESQQTLRDDQTGLRGQIRLFSTIDFGQTVVSRLIASFIQTHPAVTMDLAYTNRPLHMIEEGCDAGIIAGAITDESVVANSLGQIKRYPVASPAFLKSAGPISHPRELRAWPWIALSSSQFGGAKEVKLQASGQAEHTIPISPVMTSEGVTSMREAVRMGLGVAVLPEWLIEEDIVSGRLVRVLSKWQAKDLPAHIVYPAERRLPLRVRRFIEFATTYMATALKAHKAEP